jgi:hypothetical protein
MSISSPILLLWIASLTLLVGCKKASTDQPRQGSKLGALALFYGRYTGTHGGRAPGSQEELLGFVRKTGEQDLKRFGIAKADDLFAPSGDGDNFVVVYGQASGADPNPIVAYEDQPKNDRRKVLRPTGAIDEIAEPDFQKQRAAVAAKQ